MKEQKTELEMEKCIKEKIGDDCKEGDNVFVVRSNYIGHPLWDTSRPGKFIKYIATRPWTVQGRMIRENPDLRQVLVQCEDNKNPASYSMCQVFREVPKVGE